MSRKSEEPTKFERFVLGFGVEELARRLELNPSAIYHWLSGRTIPDPKNAEKLQKLARRRSIALSLEEIYQHSREVRTGTSSLKPQPARV